MGRGGRGRDAAARRRQAAAAVAAFLDAVVPRPARDDAELRATPERVAEAWLDDLLDGYATDPASVLADAMPARDAGLVAVTGIDFHSMCPHHLLPSRGVAHVAYLPGAKVVGFGQLARLVDALSHRLALQEDVARQVAEALMEHLGARGAACLLEAEQSCLSVRGERRRGARAHAQSFLGALADDARLQRRFLAMTAGNGSSPSRGSRRDGREGLSPSPGSRREGSSPSPRSRGEGRGEGRAPRSRSGSRPRSRSALGRTG